MLTGVSIFRTPVSGVLFFFHLFSMTNFPFSLSPQNDDEQYMLAALKEAWKAYLAREVPVGAILVHEGHIIARGHNQVELLKDATAHAEMLCLTAGASAMDNWRLESCTLYCTMEPCAMCAGALLLSRVKTLVWGAPDKRHGANGSWVDLFDRQHPTHNNLTIRTGVLADYSAHLLREFFKMRRQENKNDES